MRRSAGRYESACMVFSLVCLYVMTASAAAGSDGWRIVYDNDFSEDAGEAWSIRATADTDVPGERVLGPLGAERVRLHLDDLPEHEHLRVTVELAVRGPWHSGGLAWQWAIGRVDRAPVLTTSFANEPSASRNGEDGAARQGYPAPHRFGGYAAGTASLADRLWDDTHAVYRLRLVMAHGEPTLQLAMEAWPLGGDTWMLRRVTIEASQTLPRADAEAAMADAFDHHWVELGESEDGDTGWDSVNWLVRQMGIDAVRRRLVDRLTQGPDGEHIAALVGTLDDDDFAMREQATEELRRMGGLIEQELKIQLRDATSFETRSRLKRVLERLEPPRLDGPDRLRHKRAILALRLAGGDAAAAALDEVIEGSRYEESVYFARWQREALDYDGAVDRIDRAMQLAREGLFEQATAELGHAEPDTAVGDRLAAAQRRIAAMAVAAGERDDLLERLEQEGDDPELRRQLAMLLLRQLDDPVAAWRAADPQQTLAAPGEDDDDMAMIALAGQWASGEGELEPEALHRLGDWYLSQAEQAGEGGEGGEAAMLRRAVACFEALAARDRDRVFAPDEADATPASQPALVRQVRLARQLLERIERHQGDRIDLLALVEVDGDGVHGQWQRLPGGGVAVSPGEFRVLALPVWPTGSYELRVRLRRTEGNDGIFITVPAGEQRGNFNLAGWGSTVSGLEWIGNRQANQNDTSRRPSGIVQDQWHELAVTVHLDDDGNVELNSTLDGAPFIDWSGPSSLLSTAAAWRAPEGRMAIGAHSSRVVFDAVELRVLDGELRRFDREAD